MEGRWRTARGDRPIRVPGGWRGRRMNEEQEEEDRRETMGMEIGAEGARA